MRCHSTPGFIVNRVARPYYSEAWRAPEEQVAAPEVIDAALRDGAGFPMGPLELTDPTWSGRQFCCHLFACLTLLAGASFFTFAVQQELGDWWTVGQEKWAGRVRLARGT
ncbi:3-hydroxyacyl-CoA dehydrogenase family protein [Escherichia coli]|nr:3-hydroxyacyl-CoA dehydrogenase family protein [Escherichia coli]